MPLKQTTPKQEVNNYINAQVERLRQALVYNLSYIGEQVRNEAIQNGSYTDQTGNLRSSVGYIVAIDGKVESMSSFGAGAKLGQEGKKQGEAFARKLIAKYPKGVVLVVVAGMHYATYVSATGRNVLESAELMANRLVPTMLKQLGLTP